ncbi:hypothetical protein FBZ94_1202 [Bradyrhizobium sacchari]|uniref:Integrase-like protein n=1 Tax=Bradyrhizobium sacchari TaxID=1399419 RepID=A0A560HP42_9BRAD|nr:hypothetical protein FBZ94_1202 [Bradyrhizobium sacchari]TWB66035.1 hypothetical protein FBZ95_11932 [Bradyrhizobium sacchari]
MTTSSSRAACIRRLSTQRGVSAAELGAHASRAAAPERHADAVVGGVLRRKLQQLQLCVVLGTLQEMGRPSQANAAPGSCRRREAVHDSSGHTMEVVDGLTGELRSAQIYVAVLGAWNYTYAEANLSQSLPDWIASRSGICVFRRRGPADGERQPEGRHHSACFHEPMVNWTYADLARHYRTAIVPARPYRPTDKAKVEVGSKSSGHGFWRACATTASSRSSPSTRQSTRSLRAERSISPELGAKSGTVRGARSSGAHPLPG